MDRTSQRFTASTRAITFAGAFIVAIGLQVDTMSLVNRLSADDKLREAFVSEAIEINKERSTQQSQANAAKTEGQNQPSSQQNAGTTSAENATAQHYRAFLAEYGIIKLPSADLREWWTSLKSANYLGLLITALLLSLGAPFWYSALSGLLQLRSGLAIKDDAQRSERQSSDTSTSSSATPPASRGERGDMLAVG
jgi:hypothetical protein